jgi:hypothetical protein
MSKLQPGVGYTFTSDSKGYNLSVDTPGRKRAALEVYTNAISATAPAVSVQPGSVNKVIPTIGGNYIDAVIIPQLAVSATGYIYLKATRGSGTPFPATVEILFAATLPADTASLGHLALASVTKTGNSLQISQLVRASLITARVATSPSGAYWYWFNV